MIRFTKFYFEEPDRRILFTMRRVVPGAATLVLCLCGALLCQETSTGNSATASEKVLIGPQVNLKFVFATVRDKHGKIVSALKNDDFELQEDGHPVTLKSFSRETDLPLTLGLLVDTSMSQRTVIDEEKSASKTFLDQVLREKDSGFLLHFDREVELLQDLTSSRDKLKSAIESLQTRSRYDHDDSSGQNSPDSRDDDSQRGGRRGGGGVRRGGTQLYDAIYLASDELMKKQPGRKAVVVLSDGVDRGSKETIEGAIEAAQRSDTIVYAVYFKGEEPFRDHGGFGYPRMGGGGMGGGPMGGHRGGNRGPEEQRADGKKVLERIAKETGGRMYEISKKDPLDQIYSSLDEELRNQYSLGFTPDKADSGGYHKIALRTKQRDTEVQTREGFYLDR